MTTSAFVGNIFLYRGSGTSPETFTKVSQCYSISGVGQTNELIDATTFDSAGSREYIGGLADGAEVTVECNYESAAMSGSPQGLLNKMVADVAAKSVRNYRIIDANGSPNLRYSFAATCLSWTINPAVDDRNTITFVFKISGAITITG